MEKMVYVFEHLNDDVVASLCRCRYLDL